ncbi:hypothetical protein HMPREF0072_0573, partial [Anaerococcus lactolyticus ATCC 51172]
GRLWRGRDRRAAGSPRRALRTGRSERRAESRATRRAAHRTQLLLGGRAQPADPDRLAHRLPVGQPAARASPAGTWRSPAP